MSDSQITIVCRIKAKQATKNQVKCELSNLAQMTHKESGMVNSIENGAGVRNEF
jgi:quinol monooxygenase YgiN